MEELKKHVHELVERLTEEQLRKLCILIHGILGKAV